MKSDELSYWVEQAGSGPDRLAAAFMLGRARRSRAARAALRDLLRDEDANIRDFAAQSLAQIGDRDAVDTIMGLLKTTPPRWATGMAWGLVTLAPHVASRRDEIRRALIAYHKRARGRSRLHAKALLARLDEET